MSCKSFYHEISIYVCLIESLTEHDLYSLFFVHAGVPGAGP